MKKRINTLKSIVLLSLMVIATIACDDDFANIDSAIQGVKDFTATSKKFPLVSYTKSVTPYNINDLDGVQTNALPVNLLGVYKDPNLEFGTTTASITAQLFPSSYEPEFGDVTEVKSVYLRIPYFSTLESTDDDGNNTYSLDSIYGDASASYKLSVYENKYALQDLDPSTNYEESQAYYSNQKDLFNNQLGELLYENATFIPDENEITISEIDEETGELEVTERYAPAIYLDLLHDSNGDINSFWFDTFFDSAIDQTVFSNANNFKEYFKGITLKAENTTGNGSAVLLNLLNSNASIIIDYKTQDEVDNEEETDASVFSLSFAGIRVNTLENENASDLDGNDTDLYLKGGDGTMAVIDLFSGDVVNDNGETVDALTYFNSKKDKWLVNEANLIFYVNQNMVNGDEPERIMLYDIKNNTPIIDYFIDASTNTTSPNDSKIIYSEILERDSDENGVKYKFRLTNHINNMLLQDSTNVKLGLYVSSNVNVIQNSLIQNANDGDLLTEIPTSSVVSYKGTVLHGSLPNLPEGQRAEFEIFYTEPEN